MKLSQGAGSKAVAVDQEKGGKTKMTPTPLGLSEGDSTGFYVLSVNFSLYKMVFKIQMKKIIVLFYCFLLAISSAYAKEPRKVFNTNGNDQQLTVKVGDRNLTVNAGYSSHFRDSVLLPVSVRKSNDKEMYFETITIFMSHFVRSYKIGKVDKKYILVWLGNDETRYPAFKISVNDLKLINNRDFGENDMLAFENGVVYPLKEILKNGIFINIVDEKENIEFKNQYQKYLKTYDSPGIIESAIEAWYAKKKTK